MPGLKEDTMIEDSAKLDALMSRLEQMLRQPDDQWLTQEELDGVRLLVSHHSELVELVQAHIARRILIRTARKTLVFVGGAAMFIVTFHDNLLKLWSMIAGGK